MHEQTICEVELFNSLKFILLQIIKKIVRNKTHSRLKLVT